MSVTSPRGLCRAVVGVLMGFHGLALAACASGLEDGSPSTPEQAALAGDLDVHARPLVTAEDELVIEPLWQMIEHARVVGLGEPSHGLPEFRALMHFLVMRAAADPRPLVLVLDVPYGDGIKLDAWVTGTTYLPDPELRRRPVKDPTVFDAGRLGALRAYGPLLDDIREHNTKAPAERQIRLAGAEACEEPGCFALLPSYFRAVDPAWADRAFELMWPLRHSMATFRRTPELIADCRTNMLALRQRLLAQRDAYVAAAGMAAYDDALRLVWLGERRADIAVEADGQPLEGQAGWIMANTVAWFADRMPGARVVVFGHNDDTRRWHSGWSEEQAQREYLMGRTLAENFGNDYVAVHSTFDADQIIVPQSFVVVRTPDGRSTYQRRWARGWAPRGTLEATLRRPIRAYALDVRTAAAARGPLASFLQDEQSMRSVPDPRGATADKWAEAWVTAVPARDYDVLLVLAAVQTTRLRSPLNGPRRR